VALHHSSPECLADDVVARLVRGDLSPLESERVHAHLELCADCTGRVAEAVGADPQARWPLGTLPAGTRVGRFVVKELLGEGPGGTLYQADDPRHGRPVLLKFLRPDRAAELVREEQSLTQLSHPNVVNVQDAGMFQNEAYVVLEDIEGQRLDDWLSEQERPWREILDVFVDAGRGLAAAHALGLVHRDFKPENVIVGRDRRARLTNFGLAKATPRPSQQAAAVAAARGELAASSSAGTPAYMAPEQFRGRPADPRTDQFSFCVALYRALYRQQPFDPQWSAEQPAGRKTPLGSVHFSLLVKSLDRTTLINFAKEVIGGNVRPAPAGSDVPGWLEGVVWRGLRSDPDDRYESMEALLADVEESLGGGRARGQALSRRGSLARVAKVAVLAGGVGVLALLGLLLRGRGKK
jgi:serine/threonine protein kinase